MHNSEKSEIKLDDEMRSWLDAKVGHDLIYTHYEFTNRFKVTKEVAGSLIGQWMNEDSNYAKTKTKN